MEHAAPSIKQWFTSLNFYNEPGTELMTAVIVQAIEDSNVKVKTPPPLPDPPPAPEVIGQTAWENHHRTYKARVGRVKGRIRDAKIANNYRQEARAWLMQENSNFTILAGKLGIDADTIRDALRKAFAWAGEY